MNRKKSTYIGFVLVVTLIFTLALVSGCATQQKAADTSTKTADTAAPETYKRGEVTTAEQAKQLLIEGNKRYTSGKVLVDDLSSAKLTELAKGQKPFATILSCSDSRVPPEILFDQGLGDIFIVRTAGNVLDSIATGSVEYGVEHTKTPLLVVMGHSKCGAVKATVDTLGTNGKMEGNIGAIMQKVKPSVEKAKAEGAKDADLFTKSEDDNILAVIAELEKDPIVKELVETKKLTIVGAKYHIETGEVTWVEPKEASKEEPKKE